MHKHPNITSLRRRVAELIRLAEEEERAHPYWAHRHEMRTARAWMAGTASLRAVTASYYGQSLARIEAIDRMCDPINEIVGELDHPDAAVPRFHWARA